MMAVAEIRPDWTIGTLNLTAGSVEFTTNDSLLQTAAIQPGDEIITASGLILIIASITGQNAGTLMEPCPADAAGSDQPLRIRFQPDGSRYNGAAADLVQRLSSGNVYSLAGLDGSAGGVPVFTGPGTMDVVPTDEIGVPDPHGTLGELAALVLAANKVLTTSDDGKLTQSDITAAARVLLKLAGSAAADQMPYFTGANGAGLTPLTAFARSILDDASGSAMWESMGATETRGTNSSYVRLPSGVILQRGVWWTGNGPDVALPISYPTTNRLVSVSVRDRTSGSPAILAMTGFESQSAFAVYTTNATTGASVQVTVGWFSIGW